MKRRLQANPLRKRPTARSASDKLALIATFNAFNTTAAQIEFLITQHVSRSTIFRWKRELASTRADVSFPTTTERVAAAISVLCMEDEQPETRLVESIAMFAAWLRWPNNDRQQRTATAVLIAQFVAAKTANRPLSELSPENASLLLRHLTPEDVARSMALHDFEYVDFEEVSVIGSRYGDRQLLRDVITYFIADHDRASSSQVSLNKAFYLIEGEAFGNYPMKSRRTFDGLWKRQGASAPFHFVEQNDCSLNWHLDPFDKEYAAHVNDIVDCAAKRSEYFAKCSWVVRCLRDRLDKRALTTIAFPNFPDWLAVIPALCPTLSQDVRHRLALFGK